MTAFTIAPRHVLGGVRHTPPSDKLNIACIGMGNCGLQVAKTVENQNIVALCDVDSSFLTKASSRYEKAKTYSDLRKMLDKEEKSIEAVVIATPDHVHIPASVMAMKMGKHVYCEKPLDQNVTEVRSATRVARADLIIGVPAFQRRRTTGILF